jgi:hypothetical protein
MFHCSLFRVICHGIGLLCSIQRYVINNEGIHFPFLSPAFSKKKGEFSNRLRPSVRPDIRPSHFCVRTITLSFIKGIWNNLAQMFVIIRRYVVHNNQTRTSRIKVALAHSRSTLSIWGYMSCPVHNFLTFEGIL